MFQDFLYNIFALFRWQEMKEVEKNQAQTQEQKKIKDQQLYMKKREKYLSQANQVFGKNILSFLTFSWLSPLISLGYDRPMDQPLIPKLKDESKTKVQYEKFKKIFQRYSQNHENQQQNIYKKIILKSMLSHFKKELIIFILLCLALVGAQMYNSIFSYQVIDYIGQESRTTAQNVKYFIIFIVLSLAISLLHNYSEYGALIKGLSFASVLNLAIYNKVLKYPIISDKQFQVSEILNYSQVDVQRFQFIGYYLKETIRCVLVFLIGIILLFIYIGISFLIGMGALALFCILSYALLKVIEKANNKLEEKTDQRIKVAEQILQIIKYIKVNILEEYFLQKITKKRQNEMKRKKRIRLAHAFNKITHSLSPYFVIFITLYAFISFESSITTGKAFFLIIIFKNLQVSLQGLPSCLNQLIYFWASMKRVEKFLLAKEIKRQNILADKQKEQFGIVIQNGNFLWQKDLEHLEQDKETESEKHSVKNTESRKEIIVKAESLENFVGLESSHSIKQPQHIFPELEYSKKKFFKVLSEINLKFRKNQTSMIIGDIGSGKSSILHAILKEIIVEPNSKTNMIINGQIAYCSQKAWMMSGTMKQNILFYHPYDEEKLKNALHYSCLQEDLKIMPKGIESMIGEKGINLSGGQRARVSLARALYSGRDIYLLDDILSAVDVHVAKFLMEKTIKQFLKNKTIIMPTHAVKFLQKADNVIILNKGTVQFCNTYQNIMNQEYFQPILKQKQKQQEEKAIKYRKKEQKIYEQQKKIFLQSKSFFAHLLAEKKKEKQKNQKKDVVQQLIIAEDKQSGQVSSAVYFEYIKLNGGKIFILTVIFMLSGWTAFLLISNLEISNWCNDEQKAKKYLYFYLGYGVISSIFIGINYIYLTFCQVSLGNIFYKTVMKAILYADLNQFFNRVPMGRILNRLSKDVAEMDEITSCVFSELFLYIFSVIASLIMFVIVSTPYALIPIAIVAVAWMLIQNYYIRSLRQCVRLQKISNSPVVTGLSELTNGIQTIRAYQQQNSFFNKYTENIDNNKRVVLTRKSLEYWFFLRITIISLIVNYSIFALCLFMKSENPSEVGLLLAFIATFFDDVIFILYWLILFRLKMISIERLVSLTNLQPELGYRNRIVRQIKDNNETLQGKIQFKNYSARYRKGLPLALNNICLTIEPRKKIGIIGRTGAGKSTLINSILRFLQPSEGQLFINGKEIRDSDIKQLRNCITMIEQEPTLINATFRQNLDPTHIYTDADIKAVLKQCNLLNMVQDKGGLDSPVTNSTISVGEKQLLCICRAILKKSCIVLIDEATASVDVVNDQLIQQVIKKGFKNSTVLTIAHRLSTLAESDYILVLNQGKVVEWGETLELRGKPDSIYNKMCNQNDETYLT